MKKIIVALILGVMLLWVGGGTPLRAATEHCPDHNGHPGKVEGANNSVVLPAGTVFCVKGSTVATGKLTADGTTTLKTYLGIGKDVSYYIIYKRPVTTTTTTPETTTTWPDTTTTQPPTTTTDVTTTTATETTTTSSPTTSLPPETTTPTTPDTTVGSTTPPSQPTTPPTSAGPPSSPTLPETGNETWMMALLGTLALLGGSGAVAISRRR
jgi:LPXTG-motif cell wall-anchored protein